jgi:hypothetical protein
MLYFNKNKNKLVSWAKCLYNRDLAGSKRELLKTRDSLERFSKWLLPPPPSP